MQFLSLETFANTLDVSEKIEYINTLVVFNAMIISQLEERVSKLVDLNEVVNSNLNTIKKKSDFEIHNMIEDSAPEEKILEGLFMKKNFKYHLGLTQAFNLPLYKDRNFDLDIGIFDQDNQPVFNNNDLYLALTVFSSTLTPQVILTNKKKSPILRGEDCAILYEGNASFKKISIREVSSKFERGLITLIVSVHAKNGDLNSELESQEIRPLILKDIMVRAKKM